MARKSRQTQGLTRREALNVGVLGSAALLLPRGATAQAAVNSNDAAVGGRKPRNIIFLVSDGMSSGVPSIAEPFSKLVRQKGTQWASLLKNPNAAHGFFETYSLNSLVTDSAAASSAWASGARVHNGALNVLPDGRELTPIAELYKQAGRRVGLVTTTQMTHATPAGFATVEASRNDHASIAPQFMKSVDVLMGGGIEYWSPTQRADGLDVIGKYQAAGYTFWDHRDQVRSSATPEKVLGLFGKGHLPYTLDWRNQTAISARVPNLAEMTAKALAILEDSAPGFLLQVEGGRIDHAAHNNDAAAIIWDQLAFDDAVEVALQFAADRDDTLVVVTTDHGNANPGLNGQGGSYRHTNKHFERLKDATASFEHFLPLLQQAGKDLTASDVTAQLKAATGIKISGREAEAIAAAIVAEQYNEIYGQHANAVGVIGQVLGNHNAVAWTGITHTCDLAWLTAIGPGSEQFAGLLKNTDAFNILTRFADIDYRNPALPPDEAEQYIVQRPIEVPHWV